MHLYRFNNNGNSRDITPVLVAKLLPEGQLHNQYKQFLDKFVNEFKRIKDTDSNPIPFIFSPFHETNHNWFWRGSSACTDQEYKTLFRFTIEYMRVQGLNNRLICYAPVFFQNVTTYNVRYPGDDIVDILGFDGYCGNIDGHRTDWNTLRNHLTMFKNIVDRKNKPYCWAETGEKVFATENFFFQLFNALICSSAQPAYLMFWANYAVNEYYIPCSELKNNAIKEDFLNFTQRDRYQIEGEMPNLYD